MWKYFLLPFFFFSLITGSIEADEIEFYIKPEEPSRLYFSFNGQKDENLNWIIVGKSKDGRFNTSFWDLTNIKKIERKGNELWITKEYSVWILENLHRPVQYWHLYLLSH